MKATVIQHRNDTAWASIALQLVKAQTVTLQRDRCIALTLALSSRKGDSYSPGWEESLISEHITVVDRLLPLPGGEGWGEGEFSTAMNHYD